MKIAFTFRNLDSSESIKNYAADKIGKLQKYMQAPIDVTATFWVERHLHCVELGLHGSDPCLAHEQQEDMYAAIDLVVDKVRKQLNRSKVRLRSNKRAARSAA